MTAYELNSARQVLEILIAEGEKEIQSGAEVSEYQRGCLMGYKFALSLIAEPEEKEKSA